MRPGFGAKHFRGEGGVLMGAADARQRGTLAVGY